MIGSQRLQLTGVVRTTTVYGDFFCREVNSAATDVDEDLPRLSRFWTCFDCYHERVKQKSSKIRNALLGVQENSIRFLFSCRMTCSALAAKIEILCGQFGRSAI